MEKLSGFFCKYCGENHEPGSCPEPKAVPVFHPADCGSPLDLAEIQARVEGARFKAVTRGIICDLVRQYQDGSARAFFSALEQAVDMIAAEAGKTDAS